MKKDKKQSATTPAEDEVQAEPRVRARNSGAATRSGAPGGLSAISSASDYTERATQGFSCLLAVAQGFGGPGRGDLACRLALDAACEVMDPARFEDERDFRAHAAETLTAAVRAADARVAQAGASPERAGLGATLTCVAIDSENAFVAHVGNARVYIVTERGARQVTADHVELTETGATRLTRALGAGANPDADVLRVPLREGEAVLVCSHGVYTALGAEGLGSAIAGAADLQEACEMMAGAASELAVGESALAAWRVPSEEARLAKEAQAALASKPPKKRRWWLVALVTLLVIALLGAAGFAAYTLWLKKDNGENGPRPKARFEAGDVATITTGEGDNACYLVEYPGGAEQIRLYDGWKVRILSPRYSEDEWWYRVEVTEGGAPALGQEGYVEQSFLLQGQ